MCLNVSVVNLMMLTLFSPAKINLFLRIGAKRPDGYHNLSSLFQTVSLGDTLTIELHAHDQLTCTDPELPTDTSNLVLKATELFRQKTGLNLFFKLHLLKRVPTQAGLGGGSSNAATTLWGCNLLAKTDLSVQTLQQWGAELGSDVPFFFSQGTAHCTGRGEFVAPVPPLPSRPLWIIKPPYGLSTREVYQRYEPTAIVTEQSAKDELMHFLAGTLPPFNDLEAPAFELKSELENLKKRLMEMGFETVLMSGSGSAFFCLGHGKPSMVTVAATQATFINRAADQWYAYQ